MNTGNARDLWARVDREALNNILYLLLSFSLAFPAQVLAAYDDPFHTTRDPLEPQYFGDSSSVSNGAFTHTTPVAVPPGRSSLQPDVKLTYSSIPDRAGGILGYGWSLNIPYIERLNKLGTDKLYSQDKEHTFFFSSLTGELLPVVSSTPASDASLLSWWSSLVALPYVSFTAAPRRFAQAEPIVPPDSEALFENTQESVTASSTEGEKVSAVPSQEDIVVTGASNAEPQAISGLGTTSPQTNSSIPQASLVSTLDSMSWGEQATVKGQVIAELGSIPRTRRGAYDLAILSMEPIDGGVQVFVKAWDKNDEPIGFGKDGTVEIERFRFFNPPVLVDDQNGDIVRTWVDDVTLETRTRRLREDPREALLQSLAHTISIVGKDGAHIQTGKVGRTTDTYYPNAGSGGASTDGVIGTQYGIGSGASWNTHVTRTSGDTVGTSGTTLNVRITSDLCGGDCWRNLYRAYLSFDTSPLGSDDVTSATLSVYGTSKTNGINISPAPTYDVYTASFASSSDLVADDYDQVGTSTQTSGSISYASWSTSAYNTWTLSATGTNNINKSGVTKVGIRDNYDASHSTPNNGAWNTTEIQGYASDQTGTANDPKLVVVHSAPPPPVGPATPTTLLVDGQSNPTDISTTSPYFSALHVNASSTALAASYQIQVSTSTSFASALYWDSGKTTLSSSTPSGMRSPDIYATTTFPVDHTVYYWRIKFWDQMNTAGDWSTTTDYFTKLLTYDLTGDYRARVDNGDFVKYTYDANNTWTAWDKKGNRYLFGQATTSRIENSATTTFRWYLNEVRDPNGNKVSYDYIQDGFMVYPSSITYSDTDVGGGIFETRFLYEPRTDMATSSHAGYPVVTKQRLKDINVHTNGQLTRHYVLGYGTGDNGYRSMLTSLQESGWDASVGTTSLPAQTFAYATGSTTWSLASSGWTLPGDFVHGTSHDMGYRIADANGDALPDILYGYNDNTSSSRAVYINNGSDWVLDSSWTNPVDFSRTQIDQGIRYGDVNGDGLADLVQGYCVAGGACTLKTYLNNGTSTWIENSAWAPPAAFIDDYGYDQGSRLVDVNGDGLPDFVRSYNNGSSPPANVNIRNVYINTGSGWTYDASWEIPIDFVFQYDRGVRLADVNGDGLADIVQAYSGGSGTYSLYLNNGHGWTLQPQWNMPTYFGGAGTDDGTRLVDFNNDGLPDVVQYGGGTNKWWYNTGSQFVETSSSTFPETIAWDTTWYGVYAGDDIDGNGFGDIVRSDTGTRRVYLKGGYKTDLLTSLTSDKGGRTTITYQATPQYRSNGRTVNPKLPFVLHTVYAIALDPGFSGAIATTTYSYAGGEWYASSTQPTERQFAGFASTTKTNTLGHTVRTYFHQGNSSDSGNGEYNDNIAKAGKPYRVETLDGTTTSANIFSRVINKWARADYGDGRNFVKLIQTIKQVFDGDSSHRDTAQTLVYDDATGNVTTRGDWGEVSASGDGTFSDIGTDAATTTYSYAASSTNATMSLPSRELVTDQSGNTVRDTKWYYDSLAHGSVTYGNQTKEEKLVSGSVYASTTKSYNTYGLVTESRDPLGNATTYVYDTLNLYPATTTNALGQNMTFVYDYSSGKLATSSDENGKTIVTDYDGLDRPIREKQPDFTTPTTLVVKAEYTYTDSTSTSSSIFRRDYLTSATATDQYTYLDGLGRTIQTKKEAEPGNGWATRDTVYNSIGAVGNDSLPYFTSGSAWGTATTAVHLFTNYAYDPESRILTVADALGTTTNTYSDWRLTVTDPLANKKDLYRDAYGNLATVVEWLYATSSATTTYTWNLNKKLTKITDALSNVRNFTYDLLGRLTGSEDLHASGDSTFGTTSRQYDLAGNLRQLYTPLGTAINYTYDALNRVAAEDATSTPGYVDVVYSYDTCTNGKGRLCEAQAHNRATTTYAYNPIGLISSETVKIKPASGSAYEIATTSYQYHRNGIYDRITYPDSAVVTYVYDDAGLPNIVFNKETSGATSTLVTGMNWSPLEQLTSMTYSSGPTLTITYDQTKKYRPVSRFARRTSSGTIVQNIAYTWDAVGNMTRLVDTGSSTARKTVDYVYDNLYRLRSASTTVVATSSSQYRKTYNYDALGSITDDSGTGYTYAGTEFANPHAVTQIGASAWTYDNAGNALTAGSATYSYDYLNRLGTTTISGATTTATYAFDSTRVLQKGATTTYYAGKLYEYTPGGYDKYKHIFVGGQLVSTIYKHGAATNLNYVLTDHLGGSGIVTNSSGVVIEDTDYYPFGSVRSDQKSNTFNESRKFIGERYDSDTALSFLNARYYSGGNGKFLSQDPVSRDIAMMQKQPAYILAINQINGNGEVDQTSVLSNPQLLNSYSYAADNPLTMSDPSGNNPLVIAGVFGAAFAIGQQAYNDIDRREFSGVKAYTGQALVGGTAGAGAAFLALESAIAAAGVAAYGAYSSSVLGDAYSPSNTTGQIDHGKAAIQAVVAVGTMGAGKLLSGVSGIYPKLSTLVRTLPTNPVKATANFFFGAHGKREFVQQVMSTGASTVVDVNSNRGTPSATPARQQRPRRRKRKETNDTIYEPNQRWMWQGFLFLGGFALVTLLSIDWHDPLALAMLASIALLAVMFYALAKRNFFVLKDGVLIQHDLFVERRVRVADISAIKHTNRGFFGGTDIITPTLTMTLNGMIFDDETCRDLIEDVSSKGA